MIARMSTRSTRPVTVAAVLASALLLVAGCGDDSTDAVATTDTVATTMTTTAAEPGTTATTTTGPQPGTTTSGGTTTMTIVVKNAAPVGGIQRATVKKGDHVALVVYSDVEDEVHVHGYNFATDVDPTVVGKIDFVADVPGRFEVELEDRGAKIAELSVTP